MAHNMRDMNVSGTCLVMLSGLMLATSGCAAGTFDVTGTVEIAGGGSGLVSFAAPGQDGEQCDGTGEFGDFREGADVVVLAADGTKLAVGSLSDGVLPDGFTEGITIGFVSCVFEFEVPDVEDSSGPYTIQIGGVVDDTFTRDEASDLELSATAN